MARRIRIYLTGVFLGCICVYFLLVKGYDRNLASWTPNERVLYDIRERELNSSKSNNCLLDCYQIKSSDLEELMKEGDVLFSESEPKRTNPLYWIKHRTVIGTDYKVAFEIQEKEVILKSVELLNQNKTCNCN